MFDSDVTRALARYYGDIRAGSVLPSKRVFDPMRVAPILDRVFLLSKRRGSWRVRLAGTGLYDVYGRELAGQSLEAMWFSSSGKIAVLLDRAAAKRVPFSVAARCGSSRGEVRVETALFPLIEDEDSPSADVFVGAQGRPREWWVGSHPVTEVSLAAVRFASAPETASA